MIRERHRRDILALRRRVRRAETVLQKAREEYYELLRESHADRGTPSELSKLTGLSLTRIKQILYGEK